MVTATIKRFDASDTAAAKTQLEALAAGATDKVLFWTVGKEVIVAKVTV